MLNSDCSHYINRISHAPRETISWLKKHPVEVALVASGLIALFGSPTIMNQIDSQKGLIYTSVHSLNEIVNTKAFGHQTLEGLRFIMSTLSSVIPQTHPQEVPLIQSVEFLLRINAFAAIAGPALRLSLPSAAEYLFKNRENRKLQGIEPLKRNETVTHVFIGPAGLISNISQTVYKKNPVKKRIVGVHLDDRVPPEYGQTLDYHLYAGGIDEIIGLHASTTNHSLSFIEASGMNRAEIITIACINPDNAIFYGGLGAQIPPTFISTLLNKLPRGKDGKLSYLKKLNVVVPADLYLGQSTLIMEELGPLVKELGIKEFNIVIPESLVLDDIKSRLDAVKATKKPGDKINLTLIGQGSKPEDKFMLENFQTALQQLYQGNPEVNVNLVDYRPLAGKSDESDAQLKKTLTNSDCVVCYGDRDEDTTSLARMALSKGVDPKKLLALIEREGREFDCRGINTFLIYKAILQKFT